MASNLLALEWDDRRVVAVSARVAARRVRVDHCLILPWPNNLLPAEDPQQAGAWLRRQLHQVGVSVRRALVALPRETAMLKYLQLPSAKDEELPQLVGFQVAGRSPLPLEELRFDFVPLPPTPATAGRAVVLAAARRNLLAAYHQLAHAAGLEVDSLGLSSVAMMEVIGRHQAQEQSAGEALTLAIVRGDAQVELLLAVQGRLIGSHLSPRASDPGQEDESLLAAVRRVLAAPPEGATLGDLRQIVLVGGQVEYGTLPARLSEEFCCWVSVLDPFDLVQTDEKCQPLLERAEFASVIGLLLAEAERRHPGIDFLHPRRPVVKKNRRKLAAGLAVALVLLLCFVGWWYLKDQERQLDAELTHLVRREKDLQKLLENGQPALKSAQAVAQWMEGDIQWLDELLAFTRQMPPAERVYLLSLHLDALGKSTARLTASGYVRESQDVMALNDRLLKLRQRYKLEPRGISQSQVDKYYPLRFELESLINASAPLAPEMGPSAVQVVGSGR